jgi:hypothetical protein
LVLFIREVKAYQINIRFQRIEISENKTAVEKIGDVMFDKINERSRKLTAVDIGLVKWSVFFATIVIVKFFPQLLRINCWILISLALICGAIPFYKFWIKK